MVSTARHGMALSKPESAHNRRRSVVASTTQLFEPTVVVQLLARVWRPKLDRALATGAVPSALPLLAARAAQLVDPRTPRWIAASLEQLTLTAEGPPSRLKTLRLRGAVRPNQEALIVLARTLRHGRLQYPRHPDAAARPLGRHGTGVHGPDRGRASA
jgi:hypothetical protein